jgi:Tol biopolymer transport system component
MRRVWFACALAPSLLVVHCGSGDASPPGHLPMPGRTTSTEAGAGGEEASLPPLEDAGPQPEPPPPEPCNRSLPFRAPELLGGIPETFYAATPRLSLDELTLYFTTRVDAGNGSTRVELVYASRTSRSEPFGPPTLMTAESSPANDHDPMVGADHLTLWFHSTRGGNADLYFASRPSDASPWSTPAPVPNVNTASADAHPYYRAANAELWFTSNRNGRYDIFRAPRTPGGFAPPELVTELSSEAHDWQPMITEDGLTILFASTREGGVGKADLYLAERSSQGASFGPPELLAELSSEATDYAGFLSPDRCRVYFSSGRNTGDVQQQLFFAERPR